MAEGSATVQVQSQGALMGELPPHTLSLSDWLFRLDPHRYANGAKVRKHLARFEGCGNGVTLQALVGVDANREVFPKRTAKKTNAVDEDLSAIECLVPAEAYLIAVKVEDMTHP